MAPKHASGARVEQGFFGQVMRGNRQGRKNDLSALFVFCLAASMVSRRRIDSEHMETAAARAEDVPAVVLGLAMSRRESITMFLAGG